MLKMQGIQSKLFSVLFLSSDYGLVVLWLVCIVWWNYGLKPSKVIQ
jgi:hypothetical protein